MHRKSKARRTPVSKYRYLFFDLDGTLVNTYEGVTKAFIYALQKLGV